MKKIRNFGYFFIKPKSPSATLLLIMILGVFLWPYNIYASDVTEKNIIDLTNRERLNNDLPLVTVNELLTKAAYDKGHTIIEEQIFAHDLAGKKFSAWIKEVGYDYSYVGENLALDFITGEGAIKAWMGSPTHQKNILNSSFREIGVAVIGGNFQGKETTLIVQIFGAPRLALSEPGQPINLNPGTGNKNLALGHNAPGKTGPYLSSDNLNQKLIAINAGASYGSKFPPFREKSQFILPVITSPKPEVALTSKYVLTDRIKSPLPKNIIPLVLSASAEKASYYFGNSILNNLINNLSFSDIVFRLMLLLALLLILISYNRYDYTALSPIKNN
ncbi:MAG: CAP domain-containing protein [Planctomycetes bacterium]|jgi:hypothetical protein|nr:CAP domain-containing protein [Planctomycetota bacterium]